MANVLKLIFFVVLFNAVAADLQEDLGPYLLPIDHPIHEKLDRIFQEKQPLRDVKTLRKAGFKFSLRKGRFMIVAKHKELKGYLVKLFLDNHPQKDPEWREWIRRIQGAEHIRISIENHGYHALLKVPQKWIYLLPKAANKRTILIVEDMRIVPHGKNAAKYRFMMDEEKLEALFVVLKENLLFDSIFLDNIPFCKDRKIAFIDTEHFHSTKKAVPYQNMLPHLSSKMQKHWKSLMAK